MVSTNGVYAWLGITPSTTQSNNLVTSPVFSPLVLACIRLTFAVYTLGTVIAVLAHDSIHSSKHDAGGCVPLLFGPTLLCTLTGVLIIRWYHLQVLLVFHGPVLYWHNVLLLGIGYPDV